ncbi:hypothetical protein VHEMI02074 [[Torrubiella] hemipterigena]|uniref:Transcription regulator Rua1 C-terminal domain-containing protein n=1 Tax=[Torrubiella] hemipterigena TaxID=1531966 RepID=A0A0A1SNL1_9HYPO|nr:hypothetical protein VHEMI02074 [[Torrubiella] hemipterigena]
MLAMENRPTAKLHQRFRPYRMPTPLETVPETTVPPTTTTHTTTATMASTTVAWSGAFSQPQQEQGYLSTNSSDVPVCDSNSFSSLTPAWSSPLPEKPVDAITRPDLLPPTSAPFDMTKSQSWTQKPYEEPLEFYPFDPDAPIGQAYTTDEAVPIIDLRFQSRQDFDNTHGEHDNNRRPASSMTVSTCGPISDLPSSFEEFAANMSDQPGFSDYPGLTSNRTSVMSSSQISPTSSPRTSIQAQPRHEQVRSHSRTGRMSSSPRPSSRVSPYSLDSHRGASSRWSTPTHSSVRSSPYSYASASDVSPANQRLSLQPSSMPLSNYASSNFPMHRPQVYTAGSLLSQTQPILAAPPLMSSMGSQPLLPEPSRLPQAPTLASHGLLRMLQSNDTYSLRSHYADFADPPDLFASLHEEPCKPPPEDMNPSDPDMVPYEQEVRFEGDLYTPMLVRGHGNKREGWCGMCKPGRWLVLKNSAYWYDKSFTHGISAATGQPFQEPLDKRRMDGNPDVWEGLCGSCNEWIALVSSKKKGTTWFRHAYKCHTHAKVKDVAKRRRENHQNKSSATSQDAASSTTKEKETHLTPRSAYTPMPMPMLPAPSNLISQTYMNPATQHSSQHFHSHMHIPAPPPSLQSSHSVTTPATTVSMSAYPSMI